VWSIWNLLLLGNVIGGVSRCHWLLDTPAMNLEAPGERLD